MTKVWLAGWVMLLGLVWASPAKQIVLLDVSQSMIGKEDGRTLVWPFVQRQLLRFADRIPEGEVRVMLFGAEVLGGPSFQFPKDRGRFKSYVRSLRMKQNGSAIVRSLASVYTKECSSGAGIYLFTDGLDNRSGTVAVPPPGDCSLFVVTAGRPLPAGFTQSLEGIAAREVVSVEALPRLQVHHAVPPRNPGPPKAVAKTAPGPDKAIVVRPKPSAAPTKPTLEPLAAAKTPATPQPKPVQTPVQKLPQRPAKPVQVAQANPKAKTVQPEPTILTPVLAEAQSEQRQNPEMIARTPPDPAPVAFPLWPSAVLLALLPPLLIWRFRMQRPRRDAEPPNPVLPPSSFSETLALAPGGRSKGRIELLLPQEKPMLVYPREAEPIDLGSYLKLPALAGLTVRLTGEGMFVCQLPQQAKARLRTKGIGAGDLIGYGEILALETTQGQLLGWIRAANRRLSLKAGERV